MALLIGATTLVTAPFLLFMSRRGTHGVATWWARSNIALLRGVVGIEVEIRGRENIPAGAAVVAAKHQSTLETFVLMPALDDAVFVLKRELLFVPFFGWFLSRLNMIAIDRRTGGEALIQMIDQAEGAARQGRQIVIFPEGTRRPVGAPPVYKSGVAFLYDRLKIPCVPVAVDTGVFWPRGGFRRRQGRAVIAFLEPIEAGLRRDTFEKLVRERIETASAALAAEALRADRPDRSKDLVDRQH